LEYDFPEKLVDVSAVNTAESALEKIVLNSSC